MTGRFVFDFGPVPSFQDPVYAVAVTPADAERELFYVSDRKQGLERVIAAFPGDQITVAPNLADEARTFGLASGTLPDGQMETFAAAALNFAAGEHISQVADESAVGRFLSACLAFHAAKPWLQPNRVLRASLTGAPQDVADVAVLGPPEDSPGFTAYLGKDTLDRVLALTAAGDIAGAATLDQLSVALEDMPPWIGNTMQAVLGVSILPIPTVIRNGARVHIDAREILTLAAIAQAIAAMSTSGMERSTARVKTTLHRVDAEVTRRA